MFKNFCIKMYSYKDRLLNERGALFETLLILGVIVLVLGGTFIAARDPIITWWNTRVAIYWT